MTDQGKLREGVRRVAVNAGDAGSLAAVACGHVESGDDSAQQPAPPPGRFWHGKSLAQMSAAEWESLCDGCGRCCLVKLEDDDTGEVYTTDVACRLLDCETCRCSDYDNRFDKVADCLKIDLDAVENLSWLPPTCAYRLIDEGKDLYWWHHLVSGSRETVHLAGISVRGRVLSEDDVEIEDLPERIVDWPTQ